MFVGYYTVQPEEEMNEPNRCVPLIFDYAELRLRMPVRKADDPLMRESGIQLPISRVL
jgi:hypothetical protein